MRASRRENNQGGFSFCQNEKGTQQSNDQPVFNDPIGDVQLLIKKGSWK